MNHETATCWKLFYGPIRNFRSKEFWNRRFKNSASGSKHKLGVFLHFCFVFRGVAISVCCSVSLRVSGCCTILFLLFDCVKKMLKKYSVPSSTFLLFLLWVQYVVHYYMLCVYIVALCVVSRQFCLCDCYFWFIMLFLPTILLEGILLFVCCVCVCSLMCLLVGSRRFFCILRWWDFTCFFCFLFVCFYFCLLAGFTSLFCFVAFLVFVWLLFCCLFVCFLFLLCLLVCLPQTNKQTNKT